MRGVAEKQQPHVEPAVEWVGDGVTKVEWSKLSPLRRTCPGSHVRFRFPTRSNALRKQKVLAIAVVTMSSSLSADDEDVWNTPVQLMVLRISWY